MAAKGGPSAKGSEITGNFNQNKKGGLSQKELAKLIKLDKVGRERYRNGILVARDADGLIIDNGMYLNSKERAELGIKGKAALEKEEWEREAEAAGSNGTGGDGDGILTKSANQMLEDMRYVYKKINGRKKLYDLIKSDDKQFVNMVKELMKIESALLSTQIRAKEVEPGGSRAVFVILKGLEKVEDVVGDVKDINLKQIARAINPDGSDMSMADWDDKDI